MQTPTRCDMGTSESAEHLNSEFLREVTAAEKEIPLFHRAFLDSIRNTGRVHELSLIMRFKMKTRGFFKDAGLGWVMFRRGKIKVLPPGATGGKEVKAI